LGKILKAPTAPRGEYKQFLRIVTVRPALVYAAGIASPIATSDGGGSQVLNLFRISANNGFVRGNRNQILVYPRGNCCEEHGSENVTLMDAMIARDAHKRGHKH
jgi:hypothetical protein